jgi:hypothetical protein
MRSAEGGFPARWNTSIDTSEATVQGDLFQPDRDGQPLGGGSPEPLLCGAALMGRTVWFDFSPPLDGGVEVTAQGFDTSVAVYRYDRRNSQLVEQVGCAATPGSGETLVLPEEVRAGESYTVQVGGASAGDPAAAAGGTLAYGFSFFADRDGDDILDALPDRCPDLPGVSAFGGCPPPLRPTVTYRSGQVGSGVRLARLEVGGAPKGARIRVSAGKRTANAFGTGGVVRLRAVEGATVSSGGAIVVRVTKARSGKGRYRFGAVGAYYRYPVSGGLIRPRVGRCMLPGSDTPRRSCTAPAK